MILKNFFVERNLITNFFNLFSETAIARHIRVFKMPSRTVILLLLKKNALEILKKDLEQDCAI